MNEKIRERDEERRASLDAQLLRCPAAVRREVKSLREQLARAAEVIDGFSERVDDEAKVYARDLASSREIQLDQDWRIVFRVGATKDDTITFSVDPHGRGVRVCGDGRITVSPEASNVVTIR